MKPTTEQVRQWVREAGAVELPSSYGRTNFIAMTKNDLEKFAALAYSAGAAAMKERAAKVCEGVDADGWEVNMAAIIRALGDDDE